MYIYFQYATEKIIALILDAVDKAQEVIYTKGFSMYRSIIY